MKRFFLTVVILCTSPLASGGDDTESISNAAEFSKFSRKVATEYQISVDNEPLKLQPRSVLRWTNPAVGEIYGDVFVWTDRGRPSAIASIYRWYSPFDHITHEFQSLATGRVKASREGQPNWETDEAGLDWKPIQGISVPSDTPTARLSALRRTARQFTAQIVEKGKKKTELRLMPQPLYRYSSDHWEVKDGAVFSFAKGTDPEIYLLIEIRSTPQGQQGFYAIARSNNRPLKVNLREEQVWIVEYMTGAECRSNQRAFTKFPFHASGDFKK